MEPSKDIVPNATNAKEAAIPMPADAESPAEAPLAQPPLDDPTDLDMPSQAPQVAPDSKPYTITPTKTPPEDAVTSTPPTTLNTTDGAGQTTPSPTGTSGAIVSAPSDPADAKGDDKAVFGFGGIVPPKAQKRWGTKKLLLLGGGIVAVLALLGGAAFAFYLPNTPENVWNTAMTRTGTGIDAVVQKATEPAQLSKLSTSKITGSVTAKMGDGSYAGDFSTTFDAKNLIGGFNVEMKSADSSQKLTAKFLSQKPEKSLYPSVYFQLAGIKTLGLDEFLPGVSEYDSKWIVVSSDTIKQWTETIAPTEPSDQPEVTSADIAEVARAASAVTKDYLFSTDPSKAVIEKRSFVGKESVDGLSTYHYQAGVNAEHAEAYCKALASSVYSTAAYKKLTGSTTQEVADAKKDAATTCADLRKSLKSTDEYDVWVDSKYKLIHKVRIPEQGNKDNYTEIGQNYKGGDDLSLFVNFHSATGKSDGKLTLDTNLASNNTKATLNVTSTDANSPFTLTATLSATASNDPVKVTVPTTAVPISDVLKKLGIDVPAATPATTPAAPATAGVQAKAQDSERQTDINSMQAHVEAYYAEKGFYPTLEQLNDPSFRLANMKGLDAGAYMPPASTNSKLAPTQSATQYGYAPTSCTTSGCKTFLLSAQLSTGVTYIKSS